jgi:hypothetical protein
VQALHFARLTLLEELGLLPVLVFQGRLGLSLGLGVGVGVGVLLSEVGVVALLHLGQSFPLLLVLRLEG